MKLLFTDTDSLCYHIETEDFYADMKPHKQFFDNSEYPENHVFYDKSNKKVIGKFKDETSGDEITEFVGLRSKMYSFITDSGDKKKKAKGVARAVVKKSLHHAKYLECVNEQTKTDVNITAFRSKLHKVSTISISKIGLSCYDDKRYILEDGISTLAYFHTKIKSL